MPRSPSLYRFFQLTLLDKSHYSSLNEFIDSNFDMKRDRDGLLRDRAEKEADRRLMKARERESMEEGRRERVRKAESERLSAIQKNLSSWQSARVSIASKYLITEPLVRPVGPPSLSVFSYSYLCYQVILV